ncbi:DUF2953 domain-containing protein [Cohnella panacarvi]|uniref:DUF2953 domain-containing protein n=1 Tax=Cohnella panacarvi TaxID=400776 RepID=UPI00047BABC8|nr:DUF2953 domain-containing protein [Cohnella panacarvi]
MAFWLWCAAFAVAFLLILAMASRIRIRVRYSRSGKFDQLVVIVQALFGLVHYQLVLPSIMIRGLNVIYGEKKTGGVGTSHEEEKKRMFGIRTFKRYWRSYRAIQFSTRKFAGWLRSTMKKVECTRWRLDFRVGTGDAAQTAVLTGLLWAVAGCASGAAGQFLKLSAMPQNRIEPNYSEPEFAAVWEADFQIRAFVVLWSMAKLGTRTVNLTKALRAWRATLAPPEQV